MNRNLLIPYFILPLILLAACAGPGPAPTPAPVVVVLPTATVTATPIPTVIPIPAKVGRWECDPSGGVACYNDLYDVSIPNTDEGWAVGHNGVGFITLPHQSRFNGSGNKFMESRHPTIFMLSPPSIPTNGGV